MSSSNSAAILGPWGGSGGDAFDDGWQNGGVVKLSLYSQNILTGLEVVYKNGSTKLHGSAQGSKKEIDFSSSSSGVNISVIVGTNPVFSGDTSKTGVVGMGAAASAAPPSVPSGINGTTYAPRILGFFGRSGDRIDRLGLYVSN